MQLKKKFITPWWFPWFILTLLLVSRAYSGHRAIVSTNSSRGFRSGHWAGLHQVASLLSYHHLHFRGSSFYLGVKTCYYLRLTKLFCTELYCIVTKLRTLYCGVVYFSEYQRRSDSSTNMLWAMGIWSTHLFFPFLHRAFDPTIFSFFPATGYRRGAAPGEQDEEPAGFSAVERRPQYGHGH